MFLHSKAVAHISDTATLVSSVYFLDSQGKRYGKSKKGVWKALLERLRILYTAYPNPISSDQGTVYTTEKW